MDGTPTPASERSAPPRRDAFRFWTHEKLRNADTDQFHHVNNAALASFFEAARMEMIAPPDIHRLMDGANLAVVRLEIDFRSELHYPGQVVIGSRVVAVGTTSLRVSQGLYAGTGGRCVASALATCVLLHPASGRAHPIGAQLRDYLLAEATPGAAS